MAAIKWFSDYQKYIYTNILTIALPGNDADTIAKRMTLVSTNPMKMWIRAVTDRSYNPNQAENYESPEFLGDYEMTNQFAAMLMKKYPDIDEETLTLLKNSQVWKYEQASLADKIGITKYILSIFPITVSTKEDVLEALFGIMRLVGDEYLGLGQGSIMSYNMVIHLYGNINKDFTRETLKNAKEQFQEILDRLDWFALKTKNLESFGKAIEIKDPRTSAIIGYELVYRLNNKAHRWLNTQGIEIKNAGIIASVKDKEKATILLKGAEEAVRNLKKYYNIDLNFVKEFKKKQTEVYSIPLQNKMKQDVYVKLVIRSNQKSNKLIKPIFNQLIGIKEDGRAEVILTTNKESDIAYKSSKQILYDIYIEKGKQPLNKVIRI